MKWSTYTGFVCVSPIGLHLFILFPDGRGSSTKWSFFWTAFGELIKSMWKPGNSDAVSPYTFKTQIQRFAPRFVGYKWVFLFYVSLVTQEAAQCTRAVRFHLAGYMPTAGNSTAWKFFMFMFYFSLILWILLIVARGSYYLWPEVTTLMHPDSFLRWIKISKPFHYFVN